MTQTQITTLQAEHEIRERCIAELGALQNAAHILQAHLLVQEKTYFGLVAPVTGQPDYASLRGQQTKMGKRAAIRETAEAESLLGTPAAQEALAAGDVTVQHTKVLTRIAYKASRTVTGSLSESERTFLVDMGRGKDAEEFSRAAERWLATRDRSGADADHDEQQRLRFFTITPTSKGTFIKGRLDNIAGNALKIALEAATPKPPKDDDRTYEQRQADALVSIADLALDSGVNKAGAAVRPHVSLVIDEETFAQAKAELARRAHAPDNGSDVGDGDGTHGVSGGLNVDGSKGFGGVKPATLEDGTPVPLSELARILCDSAITRVVIDAEAQPVDLGRTKRVYSKEQRRGVIARDRSCRFDGCDRAARWCEIHHVEPWEGGGDTSISNAALLCRFHHMEVHRGHLKIIRDSRGHPHAVLVNPSGFLPGPETLSYESRPPSRLICKPRRGSPARRAGRTRVT